LCFHSLCRCDKGWFFIANENKTLKACIATHDEQQNGVMYWQPSDTAKKWYLAEKAAENIRNLYVAITRAKHRVYLGMDLTDKNFDKYPIANLYNNYIKNNEIPPEVKPISIKKTTSVPEEKVTLSYGKFKRNLLQPKSIYSFSGLTKKQEISFDKSEKPNEIDYTDYFQFPKGSKSGTMQHEILENLDFSATLETITKEVSRQLEKYDFDKNWIQCLTQQIKQVLHTPLWRNGPSLAALENSIDEMEFMLPVGSISDNQISQWLSQHRKQPTQFKQDKLEGFLRGFIDLVFMHDNQYYIVDYKTNDLGSSFEDYTIDKLKDAIEHHFYDLQYLLYCVALIKFLQITVDGFDYQKHFGGIAYIFTRGVNGDEGQGIYTHKPQLSLLKEMIGAFDAEK
jgi:exodeoxyribonuclease V beta subunit